MRRERRKPVTGRWRCALRRFHRDQQGALLDYAMVFAFVAVPMIFLIQKLFEVLSDYFAMIAYYVTWPFL